jgi:hypothetical protein
VVVIALLVREASLNRRDRHDAVGLGRKMGIDGDQRIGLQSGDRQVLRLVSVAQPCSRAIRQASVRDIRSPGSRILSLRDPFVGLQRRLVGRPPVVDNRTAVDDRPPRPAQPGSTGLSAA